MEARRAKSGRIHAIFIWPAFVTAVAALWFGREILLPVHPRDTHTALLAALRLREENANLHLITPLLADAFPTPEREETEERFRAATGVRYIPDSLRDLISITAALASSPKSEPIRDLHPATAD